MEPSPLTQQDRPASFQRKIDSLYEQVLSTAETQQLFQRAVGQIKSGNGVSVEAALDTLTVFLDVILAKRYTNPSSDIITVLAGLDEVDDAFLDFANAVESVVRTGGSVEVRQKAVQVAIALTAGAYQTSLVSYFTHRDLFPCLIKYIQDVDTPIRVFEPFLLLGLLANYNKFEFRNPYRSRLEDFVNDAAIQKIIQGFGAVCCRSRDQYVAIQEDIAEGWTLSSTLKYIGLGVLAPSRSSTPTPTLASAPSTEDGRDPFATLPDTDASILLSAYDFTNANKLFCFNLITLRSDNPKAEHPFSACLSLTSYILQHAHRSQRSTLYGLLNLITLRILLEDQSLCSKIFDLAFSLPVRLCRQRPPFLPSTPSPRPLAAAILDISIDTLNHNLRRRLDIPLYIASINILHRLLSYLVTTRTRFPYHWPLLWQTLLSLLRFLTTYASSLTHDPDLPAFIDAFLATLSLAVGAGDTFLPDTSAHDDLFYKLVESAHLLPRFKSSFAHLSRPTYTAPAATPNPGSTSSPAALVDGLIGVAKHFEGLLEEERRKGNMGKNLGPREVSRVIRGGVETLRVPETEGLERWVRWREVEERGMVKRVGRAAVEDARRVVGGR
ncbi:MAG: hypothetical protein Q9208_005668 [Pyrenodesmia sp. 3 TL-2023]